MAKLKEEYQNRIIGELEQKLGTTNRMLVPRLQKIVVNMGFGIVSKDEQKGIVDDLTAITGQRPLLCKAKKSISNFKLREGMVIGAKVTLRGDRMWDFAERLINAALPRIRDFRGVPNRGLTRGGDGPQLRHGRDVRDHFEGQQGRQGAARCARHAVCGEELIHG